MLFWKCHNLAQNHPNFASWGCFGILRTSSCWWPQRFLKLMHPWLRNWWKRESHSYRRQLYTISSMCPKISYVLETIWRRLRKEECRYTIFWASSCQTTWPWWPDRTCLRTRQRWGAGYSVLYSPTLAPAADQPAGHDGQLQHAPHQRPRRARRILPGQQCKYSFSPPQQQVGWR